MENANRSSNVTVADVAAACDELGVSPAETNAAKVRQALGRGGMTTVQKHLQTLRDEAVRAQQPAVQVTLEAAHQAELAGLERTIERQTLQSTIDRLTDQAGELKSLLSMQARSVLAQS